MSFRDEEKMWILKKIVPDLLYTELVLRDFSSWDVAKEHVLEKAFFFALRD